MSSEVNQEVTFGRHSDTSHSPKYSQQTGFKRKGSYRHSSSSEAGENKQPREFSEYELSKMATIAQPFHFGEMQNAGLNALRKKNAKKKRMMRFNEADKRASTSSTDSVEVLDSEDEPKYRPGRLQKDMLSNEKLEKVGSLGEDLMISHAIEAPPVRQLGEKSKSPRSSFEEIEFNLKRHRLNESKHKKAIAQLSKSKPQIFTPTQSKSKRSNFEQPPQNNSWFSQLKEKAVVPPKEPISVSDSPMKSVADDKNQWITQQKVFQNQEEERRLHEKKILQFTKKADDDEPAEPEPPVPLVEGAKKQFEFTVPVPHVSKPLDVQALRKNSYQVGFRGPSPQTHSAPDGKLERPEDHPQLKKVFGNPLFNQAKMVHAMRVCPKSGQVLYLCSWKQDYLHSFYMPTWVLAQMLMKGAETPEAYRLVAEFYHHFALKMGARPLIGSDCQV